MPDLIIKPEDLEEMPEKTRELLLEYVLPKMGFHKMGRGWSTTKLKPYSTLSDKPATYIPIEAAIAVLAPLKEQGIRAASILVKDNKVASPGNFSKRGYSRAELAKQLLAALIEDFHSDSTKQNMTEKNAALFALIGKLANLNF
jgi:hypothetical protein